MSALLREWLAEKLGDAEVARDLEAAMAFVGCGRDKARDVATNHDDYLAGKRR